MNNYVVSDIHGNAERLEALLFLLRRKHPVGDYKLYVLGDLFDRGDESQKVLSIVLENPDKRDSENLSKRLQVP